MNEHRRQEQLHALTESPIQTVVDSLMLKIEKSKGLNRATEAKIHHVPELDGGLQLSWQNSVVREGPQGKRGQ